MQVIRGLARVTVGAALLWAGVLTVLRVLQPEAGTWVRLVSFTPVALPACLLAAMLLLAGALRRERASIGVLVLAVAGVALHAWWLSPFYLGSAPQPADGAERMTVMSVNLLHGAADPVQVVEEVSRREVDLLALVEVTPEALKTMDAAGFADLFPYRAGTAQPGVRSTTMLLSRTPLSDIDQIGTRFGTVVADVQLDAETIRVLAVHPRPPIGSSEDWRLDHAAIAESALDADLMMGDFNATHDHEVMMSLRDAGLRAVSESTNSGWRPTWPMNGKGRLPLPLVQIDHVLVARKLAALEGEVVGINGTDHAAVVAELGLT
ncbi:endonuclease/exonuclease/phosphatase family protein [Nocardioides sp.]|uniref:endonuclease/exonuclease/phosphatase family protein n=1 Tax=Nocardioides sp. TaxID=35761 RepID=UPI002CD8C43C|nr:endonuclease/exonuclease/phosphatase family protein [Nocardioides sp.]HXH79811.1 endonuclease/exonuclease/phosphatase family protein [Nocardioides sp.]